MRESAYPAAVSLEEKVAFLRQPSSYPDPCARVEVIETHMSWVFLTELHAYKLKKPIRREFLDFSTLEARQAQCTNEVRLNRRLAENVYLGTLSLIQTEAGNLQIGGPGRAVDCLVHMRRLPRDRMLDLLIEHKSLRDRDLTRLAGILLAFYQTVERHPMSARDYVARFRHNIDSNCRDLMRARYGLHAERIDQLHQAQHAFLQHDTEILARRAGHIVEGHGDLRPQHICLLDPPVVIDCLEFNPDFRMLDPVDELAYLSVECDRLQAPEIGARLLHEYMTGTNDLSAAASIAFYKVYRACLRAKIAIWHLDDPGIDDHQQWKQRASAYLSLAAKYLPAMSAS